MFDNAKKKIAETVQTVQKGHYHKVKAGKARKKKVEMERGGAGKGVKIYVSTLLVGVPFATGSFYLFEDSSECSALKLSLYLYI